MPKRPVGPRDPVQLAATIVGLATGQMVVDATGLVLPGVTVGGPQTKPAVRL